MADEQIGGPIQEPGGQPPGVIQIPSGDGFALLLTPLQVLEDDLAQPIFVVPTNVFLVGQVVETDLAQALARHIVVRQAEEFDLSGPITPPGQLLIAVNQVQETDAAIALFFPTPTIVAIRFTTGPDSTVIPIEVVTKLAADVLRVRLYDGTGNYVPVVEDRLNPNRVKVKFEEEEVTV